MGVAVTLLTLLLLAAVIFVISGPLRAARKDTEPDMPERRELLTAREAKYREIRDADLDYRTGKLSREDFEVVNGTLRVEANEILERLEALEGASVEEAASAVEPTPRVS